MKPFESFTFTNASYEPSGTINLSYQLGDELSMTELISLPSNQPVVQQPSPAALQLLHLIAGISYYKTSLPNKIIVQNYQLDADQKNFFDTVYTKGLGEFFYQNQIDFRGLVDFPAKTTAGPSPTPNPTTNPTPHVLVPIGGGKDSIVTIEMLRTLGVDITLLRIGKHPIIDQIAKVAGLPLLTIDRRLDPKLHDLNAAGALNGHIPITAYNSALAVVLAELYGFDAVIFSNEHSSSYGNTEYHGEQINHQWSKSLEFEQIFRSYISSYTSNKIEYFSLLRPYNELQIMREFVRYPEYLGLATSCNRNWRVYKDKPSEAWCGECPKCAFVYALMVAFLERETVDGIMGHSPFENPTLLNTYRELLGLDGIKPFECVGTPNETIAAFTLAHRRGDLNDTAAMKLFTDDVISEKDTDTITSATLSATADHLVPAPYDSLLTLA